MKDTITANGLHMPRLGLGTWNLRGRECQKIVEAALAMGYRHIDTASMYGNEEAVGGGLRASGVPRSEVHITTKVWFDQLQPRRMRASMQESLRLLGTGYVDLYLIHWPAPDMDMRAAMEELAALQRDGLARRTGVANFPVALLRRAIDDFGAGIAAEQFEFHAELRQPALLGFLRERAIAAIAYSPLARGDIVRDPAVTRIATKHGATPAQVALAWLLAQPDVAVIPKSAREDRLRENLAALDVRLDDEDRAAIEALPKNHRTVNPGFAPSWDAAG